MPELNKEAYGDNVSVAKILTEVSEVPDRFDVFMATLIGYAPLPLEENCKE
jgi:hypothetical protein